MKGSGAACTKEKRHCSPPVVEEPKTIHPKRVRFSSETKKNSKTDNTTKSTNFIPNPIRNKTRRKAVGSYNRRNNRDMEQQEKEQGIKDFIKNWDPSMRVPFSSGGSAKTRRKQKCKRKMQRRGKRGKKTRRLHRHTKHSVGGATEQERLNKLLQDAKKKGNIKLIELLLEKGAKDDDNYTQIRASYNHLQTEPGDDAPYNSVGGATFEQIGRAAAIRTHSDENYKELSNIVHSKDKDPHKKGHNRFAKNNGFDDAVEKILHSNK